MRAEAVTVRYGQSVVALDHLDLTVPAHGITCLVGANGAGKTTLLECAAGITHPSNGQLRVLGQRAGAPSLRLSVGVMLQDGGMPGGARPREFLEYVARLYPRARDVRELMASVDLEPDTRTPIRRLSGGQAARVAWAAAMVGGPQALLLDEPTAGLDPVGRQRLYRVLHEQRDRGVGILVATHLIEDVEHLADTIVVIRDGRTALVGTPDELRPRTGLTVRSARELDVTVLLAALPPGSTCIRSTPDLYDINVPSGIDPSVITTVSSWCAQHSVRADIALADLRSVLWNALQGRGDS